MAKRTASEEKVLRIVDRLLPKTQGSAKTDLEALRTESGGEELESMLQTVLIEGIRRLRDQGADASGKIEPFVIQVLELAKGLGADANSLSAHAITTLVEQASRPSRKDTRQQILEAALELFSKHGYHETTVDQIAEAAALGKGTVYRYFPNKEALYQELIRTKWDELNEQMKAEFLKDGDLLQIIRGATRIYLEFFERNAKLYRVMLKEPLDFERRMRAQYMERVLEHIPLIKDRIVDEAHKGARIKKLNNFYTVYYGYMGFIEGVIQKWVRNECRYPLTSELDTIMEVLLYGFVEKFPSAKTDAA